MTIERQRAGARCWVTAWERIDPRTLALRYPSLTVLLVVLVTMMMLYGNTLTEKGGVIDNALLDPTNVYRLSDLHVRAKRAEGFLGQEYVPFILKFDQGIQSTDDLRRIRTFTKQLKKEFGSSVLSVSEVADYRDTGETLLNDPYIPAELPTDFDVDAWKRRVAADPMVSGVLVGTDFKWVAVIRYLKPGYDEITEYRRTVEFLEGRTIPWWEWLYKTDIAPPPDVGVGGGIVVRGIIDQGVTVDNAVLVCLGIGLALPLFVWSLGSVREALIGVIGVVALGFLWTRGSIGLLQLCGVDVKERVYTLVAYTNCIVQGVSFVLHKFEAFNHAAPTGGEPRDVASWWQRTFESDGLIGATGVIAVLGFATLYSFQVLSIREMGIFSAMAVVYQLVLVTVFVPALHTVTMRGRRPRGEVPPSRAGAVFQWLLDGLASASAALVLRFPPAHTAFIAGGGTLALAVIATGMIWPGNFMVIKTIPLDFVKGTIVERTARFLDEPGRSGRDFMEFFVEPSDGDIYDPRFLAGVWRYQEQLKREAGAREVSSIVNQVHRISVESLQTPLPETRQAARSVFNLIQADLDTAIARQLFYARGLRLTVYFVGEDSIIAGKLLSDVLDLGRRHYPELRVWSFGKESLYPQMDTYVRLGKPLNVLTSQIVVFALCWVGVWVKTRNTRRFRAHALVLSPPVGGFIMSVPFLFASSVMAILMMVLGVPLDSATAVITALAINASVDFSIYFADAYQEGLRTSGTHTAAVRYAAARKGRLVLEDCLLNSICFLPLVTSRFEAISEVGWIMILMLMACAFGTVVLMPALFYLGVREPAPAVGAVALPAAT